ncbi:MAG: acetoacetate decarboxylase family protein [Elainella sp. C42_A2020_010]|nr:acetoacetate decarboxylase family protein [Elainella sp. C42_A2020_010]
MSYPPAPWHLKGFSLQTLHLLDIERVRPLIPSELNIVSVLPGKTVGGVYIASYGAGSTMPYNELIVVSGLLHWQGKVGAWISHIYVDHPDSVVGGREIWGLPKQLAQFTWNVGKMPSVQVNHSGQTLCTLSSSWQLPGWPQPVSGPVFSLQHTQLLQFTGQGTLQLQLAGVDLTIDSTGPLAELNLGRPWLGFYSNSLDLLVNPPIPVHQ